MNMNSYIGTKIVKARAMTRNTFRTYTNQALNEIDQDEDGYLVEYTDGGKPNHPNHAGYVSWSPKTVFENAYLPTEHMTFADALKFMMLGKRVKLVRWGVGTFVYISRGSIPVDFGPTGFREDMFDTGDKDTVARMPTIVKRAVDDSGNPYDLVGYVPAADDMLLMAWEVLPDIESE